MDNPEIHDHELYEAQPIYYLELNDMVDILNRTYERMIKASPYKKEKRLLKYIYAAIGQRSLLKLYKNKKSFTAEDLLNLCSFIFFTEKTTGFSPLDVPGANITLKRLSGDEIADPNKKDMCILNSTIPTENGSFDMEIQASILDNGTSHIKARWTSIKNKDKSHRIRRASESEVEVLEKNNSDTSTESLFINKTVDFLNNLFVCCIYNAVDAVKTNFI